MMGVSGIQAANITDLTPQQSSKWWSVSASLKGFYDDNVSASYSKQGSPGLEFEPSFSVNLPRERTLVTAKYLFRVNYYTDRADESTDTHHQLNFRVNHRFTQRYTLNVEDSFVYSNEPEIIAGGNVPVGYGRSNGNAVRNYAPIDFNARLTRLIGVGLGYRNSYLNYEQSGTGSRSALLDRMEHEFHVEGEWYFSETTIGFLGYAFGMMDFTSDDLLFVGGPKGSIRDARSHAGYVGAAYSFTKQLSGIGKVGVESVDHYNLNDSTLSPYVDLAVTYLYLPGSNLKLGVKVSREATDLVGTGSGSRVTADQLATVIYGGVTHRITPKITGSLLGQYMYSVFSGGDYDSDTETFLNLGLNVAYQINNNFSANVAYAYDVLSSDTADSRFREFDRNRVWAGVTVTY